jgi:probable F420-dependent oxidoreductase
MEASSVIGTARRSLGPVGAFVPVSFTEPASADQQREAAQRIERAGYRAAWTNEPVGGKDVFVQVAVLLAATERITFGTGIANIWARLPQTTHGAAALLAQAYPDRFVLGLGVGYPQQAAMAEREFGSPLATMRDYVARMRVPALLPAPDTPYPFVISANGPRMLELSGEIADGAIPAMRPPVFTARARQQLGPDKLLVMCLPVVEDADRDRARAAARDNVSRAIARSPASSAALADLGFTSEEIASVSDRLVDALAGYGDPGAIAAKVREHLAAGADHVALIPGGADVEAGLKQLERIAPALADLA